MNQTLDGWQQLKGNDLPSFRKLVGTEKPHAMIDYAPILADENCGNQ
jgi:hypothetical protein